MKGDSTCFAPKIINTKKLATNTQKANLLKGRKARLLVLPKSVKGSTNKDKMAVSIKRTPINLEGIERRIV